MTNLDKIRTMPADEMAKWLIEFNACCYCTPVPLGDNFDCTDVDEPTLCTTGICEWLMRERTEEEDL